MHCGFELEGSDLKPILYLNNTSCNALRSGVGGAVCQWGRFAPGGRRAII